MTMANNAIGFFFNRPNNLQTHSHTACQPFNSCFEQSCKYEWFKSGQRRQKINRKLLETYTDTRTMGKKGYLLLPFL